MGQAKSDEIFNWRLVMSIPKTLPVWGPGVERFAKQVAEMSRGQLNIRVYGAGELVPAFGVFDAVSSGQVEMGHSAAYYWVGKMPAAAFFTSVPFGLDPVGMNSWLASGGQELWDELYAPFGVKAFAAGNTGTQMGGWFNKEVNSIDDFKGLKMRIPGLGGKVIAKFGAKPMLVPGGEIFTNLSTGVIDATEWVGPYHDYTMGFHKAAKYYYYPGWHEPGPTLELLINQKVWDKLPTHLQSIVRIAAGEIDRWMLSVWIEKDAEYLEKIRSEGKVEIKKFPETVLNKLKLAAKEVKEELAQSNELTNKIYKHYQAFQNEDLKHQEVTEDAYSQVMQASTTSD